MYKACKLYSITKCFEWVWFNCIILVCIAIATISGSNGSCHKGIFILTNRAGKLHVLHCELIRVEPLNKGHLGTQAAVPYSEVWEVRVKTIILWHIITKYGSTYH